MASLDARTAKWMLHVYKHFKKLVLVTKKDGTITSRFVCIWYYDSRHPSKHVDHTPSDESTRNLNCHIKVCEPTTSAEMQKNMEYAQGINYSYAYMHYLLAIWTSPNIISFLGMTMHWHENSEIQHIILDFVKLAKGHTEFGIFEKVLAVTYDNASNNTKMLKEMKKTDPDFHSPDAHVRCFGHVINLVVKCIPHVNTLQAILAQFRQKVKSEVVSETDKDLLALDNPEDVEDEDDNTDEAQDAADAVDAAEIEDEEEESPDLIITDDDIKLGCLTLQKIIKLSQKVWNSPTVRGKKSEILNTVTMVLTCTLELRSILFDMCDMAEFNKPQGVWLHRFIIDEADWPILEELYELLVTFLEATTTISHLSTLLIHDVIPWIDVMTKHLEDTHNNTSKLLMKYYHYTDNTSFYCIAILMHPSRWPQAWVDELLRLLRTEWETCYHHAGDLTADNSAHGPSRKATAHDMLAAITGADELEEDALEEYLNMPTRMKKTDPLKFWNNALVNGTANAALAHMALDVLLIPTSTVLGSWARYPKLVPEGKAIEFLQCKEKGKGPTVVTSSQASKTNTIILSSSDLE
ncbi:hypothetical protein V8D89_007184 [Ganoderma adspersum]